MPAYIIYMAGQIIYASIYYIYGYIYYMCYKYMYKYKYMYSTAIPLSNANIYIIHIYTPPTCICNKKHNTHTYISHRYASVQSLQHACATFVFFFPFPLFFFFVRPARCRGCGARASSSFGRVVRCLQLPGLA